MIDLEMCPRPGEKMSAVRILKVSQKFRSTLVCDGDAHFLNWRDSGFIWSQFYGACTCPRPPEFKL